MKDGLGTSCEARACGGDSDNEEAAAEIMAPSADFYLNLVNFFFCVFMQGR